jgi:hypothetical protein
VRIGALAAAAACALITTSCRDEGPRPPAAVAAAEPRSAPAGFHFVDVAKEAGLTRVTYAGRPGKDHLLDSAGVGCAWLDYDRDSRLDAYILNGWKLEGGKVVEKGRNALYRNRGDGTFEDVTDKAGVGGDGRFGSGVAVADYDIDGWPDIFVTNFGPSALYRNRGDGTFEDVAAKAGVANPGWNAGACFFDADGDGDLDLFVAGYIACTMDDVLGACRTAKWKGVAEVAFGPFGLPGAPDHFFRSDGRGRFTEATGESGMADRALAFGFSVRAFDYDRDGDQDLYVANDSDANYLYRNDGRGRFDDVALWSGCAMDKNGHAQAGMGVTIGDADGNGEDDIFVTNFSEDQSTLYFAIGSGMFEDRSEAAGVGRPTFLPMSWGASFSDLDCDGDLDLVVASGHIYPQVDDFPDIGQSFAQRLILLENAGKGSFVDASDRAGPAFAARRANRGLAAGDYDDDGDVDLLVTALDAPPMLLRNDSARGNWLVVACERPDANLVGTRVEVRIGDRVLSRDVTSSDSFLSCPDPRLHFGLGAAKVVDRLAVLWPGGGKTVREGVAANQILTIRPDG